MAVALLHEEGILLPRTKIAYVDFNVQRVTPAEAYIAVIKLK